ncbi:hypothetical protein BDR07DRAFT_981540 [Suillus spraguei]|nr:hypothetical protein BDR07DRAFT_981540 [Suillus spraguei]
MSRGRIPDIDHHSQQLPQIQHLNHPTIQPTHKSHSRSSSHSNIDDTLQDIKDLLLDTATDERSILNAREQQSRSPHAVLAAHQSGSIPVGPLDQPGELGTYRTIIFAPPVTGAPQKKGKPGSSANITHNGSPLTPPNALVTPIAPVRPPAIPPPPPRSPTNAIGQRIYHQCGSPGRYKDNKCVERWGPGTVCDRCRKKKMKRVERRGTTDVNVGGSNNASAARLHLSVAVASLSKLSVFRCTRAFTGEEAR